MASLTRKDSRPFVSLIWRVKPFGGADDFTFAIAPAQCDFDGDGNCDLTDLNLLLAEGPIAPGVPVTPGVNEQFDLNGDGMLDNADADQWLADAATNNGYASPYRRGDANLDGIVDGGDFGRWNNNKFISTLFWDQGNFDGNGVTDGGDFSVWNANKFTSSESDSILPEPALGLRFLVAILAWGARYRRLWGGYGVAGQVGNRFVTSVPLGFLVRVGPVPRTRTQTRQKPR